MIEEQNYLDEDGNPPIVKEDDTGIRPAGKQYLLMRMVFWLCRLGIY